MIGKTPAHFSGRTNGKWTRFLMHLGRQSRKHE